MPPFASAATPRSPKKSKQPVKLLANANIIDISSDEDEDEDEEVRHSQFLIARLCNAESDLNASGEKPREHE